MSVPPSNSPQPSLWDRLVAPFTVIGVVVSILFVFFQKEDATRICVLLTFIIGWFWIFPKIVRRLGNKNPNIVSAVALFLVLGMVGATAFVANKSGEMNGRQTVNIAIQPTISSLQTSVSILETSSPDTALQPTIDALKTSVSVLSTTSPTNTLKKEYNILVDIRHGDDITKDFAKRFPNIRFTPSEISEFSSERLRVYDALIINFVGYDYLDNKCGILRLPGQQKFTDKEYDEINKYIQQGGSVLLVGLGWVWTQNQFIKQPDGTCVPANKSIEEYPLNKISQIAGIFFDKDFSDTRHYSFRPSNFGKHPITQNLSIIETNPNGLGVTLGSLFLTNPKAVPVLQGGFSTSGGKYNYDSPIPIAASTVGAGKIVCIQHPDFIVTNLDNSADSNLILLQNILNWLANKQAR